MGHEQQGNRGSQEDVINLRIHDMKLQFEASLDVAQVCAVINIAGRFVQPR